MSMLSFLNITPISQRISPNAAEAAPTAGPRARGTAIRYADELLEAMIPLDSGHRWVVEEVTADLEHVPATVIGMMIAHLADLTEYVLLHPALHWDGPRLADALDLACEAGAIAADQRQALVEWLAELLWEAGTAEGLGVYAFEDATPDQLRIALAAAWACLLCVADPEEMVKRYWQDSERLASQDPEPGPAVVTPSSGVTDLRTNTTTEHAHELMGRQRRVLPRLQPGSPLTNILTNIRLDPRHEDAQMYAAFDYAHLALARLLITSAEHIRDTVEASYSDLFRMADDALECVIGELDAIAAHVLCRMQDERILAPLSTGLDEVMNWGLLHHTETQPLVTWLAELQWRGTGDRVIPDEPAPRDALLARARTALVGAATVLYSLPDPLTGISDYNDDLAEV